MKIQTITIKTNKIIMQNNNRILDKIEGQYKKKIFLCIR